MFYLRWFTIRFQIEQLIELTKCIKGCFGDTPKHLYQPWEDIAYRVVIMAFPVLQIDPYPQNRHFYREK